MKIMTLPNNMLTSSQTILIEQTNFELIIVRTKKRRRTVALSIKPPSKLVVRAPYKTAFSFIEEFIFERAKWILARFNELQEKHQHQKNYQYINGEEFYFLGAAYLLQIIEYDKIRTRCEMRTSSLIVSANHDSSKYEIRRCLVTWYQKQAKTYFLQRLNFWSEKLNIRFNHFSISSAKTRWGSCNYKNDIRLNWRLMMMTSSIIDYVVIHELCHVIHKNHSKRFWSLVAKAMPDYKQHQEQLKKWARELILF